MWPSHLTLSFAGKGEAQGYTEYRQRLHFLRFQTIMGEPSTLGVLANQEGQGPRFGPQNVSEA